MAPEHPRRRILRWVLLLLMAMGLSQGVAASAVVAGIGPMAWRTGDPVFTAPAAKPPVIGVNYQPMWESMTDVARAKVLHQLMEAGNEWVRVDVAWGTIQPTGPDTYDATALAQVDKAVQEINDQGMKVLLMFYWAPAWSSGTTDKNGRPGNPDDYARMAAWVAERYDGSVDPNLRIDAIELWNEPDLDSFWKSTPRATRVSDFATLIRTAGPAVKAANPELTVIAGATSSVDTDWYAEFYQVPGVVGSYDAIGIHPYQSPSDAPPNAYEPDYGQYFIRHIPRLVELMDAQGDPADIWATEFGWSTHDGSSYHGGTRNWQRGVTPRQQADYLLAGYEQLAEYPRVKAAFWYNAWNTQEGDAQFDNFGLLRINFEKKLSYYAYKCVITSICGPSGTTAPSPPSPSTSKPGTPSPSPSKRKATPAAASSPPEATHTAGPDATVAPESPDPGRPAGNAAPGTPAPQPTPSGAAAPQPPQATPQTPRTGATADRPTLRVSVARSRAATLSVRVRLAAASRAQQKRQRIRVCVGTGRACTTTRTNKRGRTHVKLHPSGPAPVVTVTHRGPSRPHAAAVRVTI